MALKFTIFLRTTAIRFAAVAMLLVLVTFNRSYLSFITLAGRYRNKCLVAKKDTTAEYKNY